MKILYSYLDLQNEGSKVHVASFIKATRELGHILIDSPFSPGNGVPTFRFKNKYIRFIQRGISWVGRSTKFFSQTAALVFKENPDILLIRHLSNHHYFVSILFFSLFKPVALEINSIGSFEKKKRSRISESIDRATVFLSKKCFVVSDVVRDFIVNDFNVPFSKVRVIPNGVDINKFHPELPGNEIRNKYKLSRKFVVGFIGSFKPWHGVDKILSMAESLKQIDESIVFLVVGGGDQLKDLYSVVEEKQLSNLILTGYVNHDRIPYYLAAMDVVISPHVYKKGRFHGSPLKLFEYMAMAKPIIAAPIGQIRDIFEDGVSGRLIPSDNIDFWVEEILKMYNNHNYRQQFGLKARARVTENYTWNINANNVVDMCKEAIALKK
jgi:glycosyltransferase involved in cell wall biosynthesis